MIDTKFSGMAVSKAIAGGGLGGALIADGVVNASTGPILAGMVTIVGTAAIVVYGQYRAARTKADAEEHASELRSRAEERESLLKDYRDREKAKDARIDVLSIQLLDAERRAARNYRDDDGLSQQHQRPPQQLPPS
jgi:hypothetical protein